MFFFPKLLGGWHQPMERVQKHSADLSHEENLQMLWTNGHFRLQGICPASWVHISPSIWTTSSSNQIIPQHTLYPKQKYRVPFFVLCLCLGVFLLLLLLLSFRMRMKKLMMTMMMDAMMIIQKSQKQKQQLQPWQKAKQQNKKAKTKAAKANKVRQSSKSTKNSRSKKQQKPKEEAPKATKSKSKENSKKQQKHDSQIKHAKKTWSSNMCSLQTKPCRTTETAARNGARNDICKYAAPPATQIGAQIKSVQNIMKVRFVA